MKKSEMETIIVNYAEPEFGQQLGKVRLNVHPADQCAGMIGANNKPICCIHNPSNHHMIAWPQNWRADKGMMERLCPHGIGHPDPDDLKVINTDWAGVHGCDGCCFVPERERSVKPIQAN